MRNMRITQFILLMLCGFLRAQISTTCVPSVSIATSAANHSICIGQSASYTVSGGISYTFISNPSSSPSFTGTTGVVTPTTHTSYQVIGTNQFGCTSSAQEIIFVNQLPQISITASPTLVCYGFSSTLAAYAVPGNTTYVYNWAHGGNSDKSVVSPTAATIYTVSGTNTITTCQNTQTVNVAVFNPTFSVTQDTGVCKGNSITLVAGGAKSYTWMGGSSSGILSAYVVSPTVATVYTVSATSWTLNGLVKCNSTKTVSVGIKISPTITVGASRTLTCKGVVFYLWALGAESFYWPTINQTGSMVTVTQAKETIYTVVGTNEFGCKDTAKKKIFQISDCWDYWMGLNENSWTQKSLPIFPNPTDNSFTINAPGPLVFSLYNSSGQHVKEVLISSSGLIEINALDLIPGVYILTGWYEGKLINEKIVVRR